MKRSVTRSLSLRLPMLFVASMIAIMCVMIPLVYLRFHNRMIDQYTRMAEGVTQLDALNIQTDDEIEDLYHSLQSMTRDSFEATANAFDEDVQQCLQAGMDAHLSKPVDIDQVTGLLSRMLASR